MALPAYPGAPPVEEYKGGDSSSHAILRYYSSSRRRKIGPKVIKVDLALNSASCYYIPRGCMSFTRKRRVSACCVSRPSIAMRRATVSRNKKPVLDAARFFQGIASQLSPTTLLNTYIYFSYRCIPVLPCSSSFLSQHVVLLTRPVTHCIFEHDPFCSRTWSFAVLLLLTNGFVKCFRQNQSTRYIIEHDPYRFCCLHIHGGPLVLRIPTCSRRNTSNRREQLTGRTDTLVCCHQFCSKTSEREREHNVGDRDRLRE